MSGLLASQKFELLGAIARDRRCASAASVAIVLLDRTLKDTGTCKLRLGRIAAELGTDERTIRRAIDRLCECGYFRKLPGQGERTDSGPANAYEAVPQVSRPALKVVEGGTKMSGLDDEQTGDESGEGGTDLSGHGGTKMSGIYRPVNIRPVEGSADADAPAAPLAPEDPGQGSDAPPRVLFPALPVETPKKPAKPKRVRDGSGGISQYEFRAFQPDDVQRDYLRQSIQAAYPGERLAPDVCPPAVLEKWRRTRLGHWRTRPKFKTWDEVVENLAAWCIDEHTRPAPRQRAAAGDKPRSAMVAGSAAAKRYYDE